MSTCNKEAFSPLAIGSLVRARGREWVVLPPEDDGDVILLRPLGGREDEVTGILPALEDVVPAQFDLPDPSRPGDHYSSRLLRDAVRLGFRNSAGPFRSFARIAVDPCPYQLVPLLMALRLDPVRLLIADDVGIGKTVEACLIARELLDRGEIRRLAVLCPPQLAEQWQRELESKFHIQAEVVLPGTVSRLEQGCLQGESLLERYPFVVISTDFIKSDRRRDEFLRACPELVIVDEAHTCADPGASRGARHQRHQLIQGLAKAQDRHVLLVTATPHSGSDAAFKSLLSLLNPDFANLPENLAGRENEGRRRQLAQYMVQRRRSDLQNYVSETTFPARDDSEETYALSEGYRKLFERVLAYAREQIQDGSGGHHRQRVRWWSVLALLRALASSPAAAAATLRARAAAADTETPEEADAVGMRTVLDQVEEEPGEGMDVIPGSDPEDTDAVDSTVRRRLQGMARDANQLIGKQDAKLQKALGLIGDMLKDGWRPIVFCRFIATAHYVGEALRARLPKSVQVEVITGDLPPSEREERVAGIDAAQPRVLVCTDCLSEGINLQEGFDAIFHYDLSWNPTRHEQREGRVDRFGQRQPKVRVVTYYGVDNGVDGVVLEVLIRKHRTIRQALGISVPVPDDTDNLLQALMEGVVLRTGRTSVFQPTLPFAPEDLRPRVSDFNSRWDAAADREKKSRTSLFAQASIDVSEVARDLKEMREAIGSAVDVQQFVATAVQALGGIVTGAKPVVIDLQEMPTALRDTIGSEFANGKPIKARFNLPVGDNELYLERTHPLVEGIAAYVMNTALDPIEKSTASRCGVIRTSAVDARTTALLVRYRYHIVTRSGGQDIPLLAEDCQVMAFRGSPASAEWLDSVDAEVLIQAMPSTNISPEEAEHHLRQVMDNIAPVLNHLEKAGLDRSRDLLEAHRRVRTAANWKGVSYSVEPQLPPDLLGVYLFLPDGADV